jgi:hypothetical protein
MTANHRLLRCTRYLLASVHQPCLVFWHLPAGGLRPASAAQLTASGGITYTIFGPDNMVSSVVFLFAGASSFLSADMPVSRRLQLPAGDEQHLAQPVWGGSAAHDSGLAAGFTASVS